MRALAAIAMLAVAATVSPAWSDTRVLLVPGTTLYPGDALSGAGLSPKSFTGSAKILAGYVESPAEAAGKFARRTLVAGKPIPFAAIRDAEVVFEGQPAQAAYVSGGLTITATLVPLASAAAGDIVKARNPDTGLTVMAVALADGSLQVEGP